MKKGEVANFLVTAEDAEVELEVVSWVENEDCVRDAPGAEDEDGEEKEEEDEVVEVAPPPAARSGSSRKADGKRPMSPEAPAAAPRKKTMIAMDSEDDD